MAIRDRILANGEIGLAAAMSAMVAKFHQIAKRISMLAFAIALTGLFTPVDSPLVVGAEPSQALPISVSACDLRSDDPDIDERWAISSSYSVWVPVNACPDSLVFEFRQPMPVDGGNSQAIIDPRVPVRSVTLTLEGGDNTGGVLYQVFDSYPATFTQNLPARAPGDGPSTVKVEFPTLAARVGIRAICPQAPCPVTENLTIRDIKWEMDDPWLPLLTGPWNSQSLMGPLKIGSWNRPTDLVMSIYAKDNHTGVRSAGLVLDNTPLWDFDGDCLAGTTWTVPIPCPIQSPTWGGPIGGSGLRDGAHTLRVRATDGAMNTTGDVTYPFSVDSVPPARPADVVVSDLNEHGWTAKPQSDVSWTTVGELAENATQSGLVRSEYDVDPVGTGVNPAVESSAVGQIGNLTFPADGRWEVWIRQVDRAGHRGAERGVVIGRDTDIPFPPTLSDLGWVSREQLIAGVRQTWQPPGDLSELESGICGYAVGFGEDFPSPNINVAGAVAGILVPSFLPEGPNSVHVRTVSCSGLASETTSGQIRMDATLPTVTLDGVPTSLWSRSPVTLELNAADALSGIDGIRHSIDDGPAMDLPGASTSLEVGEGIHTVKVSAHDKAGNRSAEIAKTVQIDSRAPRVTFEPTAPTNPAHLRANISDATSGVADAHFEYSRVDAGANEDEHSWHPIEQVLNVAAGPSENGAMSAYLPDAELADGIYAVRVAGRDRAGNQISDDENGSSHELILRLPLRERPSLTAKIATYKTRCPSGSRRTGRACGRRTFLNTLGARSPRLVRFGQRAVLVGELRRPNGEPIADAPLRVFERTKHGKHAFVAGDVITGGDGGYSFELPRSTSSNLSVHFGGSGQILPANATATLGVRAGAIMRIAPRRLHVGERIRFSGTLLSGGAGLPSTGKKVEVEYLVDGKRRSVVATPKTDLKGRFRGQIRPSSRIRKPTKLVFRAFVDSEDPWPFETGTSNSVAVTLLP